MVEVMNRARTKGGIMLNLNQHNPKTFVLMLLTTFILALISSPAVADDAGLMAMKTNLSGIADEITRWSKQAGTGKLTPEAQMRLSELLAEAGELLKEMSGKGSGSMYGAHQGKIQMMKKSWDPFDTSSGM